MQDNEYADDFSDCDEYRPLPLGKAGPHPDDDPAPDDEEWLLIAIAKEEEREWLEDIAEQEYAKEQPISFTAIEGPNRSHSAYVGSFGYSNMLP